MKYLVITTKDSFLLTEQELRVMFTKDINRYNCRVFRVIVGEQKLQSVRVIPWSNKIPWIDIIDIFGNLLETLKPKGE